MDYYVVDAFTYGNVGGNTAGVVLCDNINEDIMQAVAAELSFSETAFINRLSPELFSIRYFTPNSEIELCGHATIASFKVLLETGLIEKNYAYKIKTLSCILSVYLDKDLTFMESGKPESGPVLDIPSVERLCAVMGISQSELGSDKYNLCPQIVSTGLKDIMLPIKSSLALNKMQPDFKALTEFSSELGVVGVHAFTLDSSEFTARCRNFAPLYGIDEESATGTSNASLTYYLFKNKIIKNLDSINVFCQGESMGNPSRIYTKIIRENGGIFIGGEAKIKKIASS